MGFSFEAVMKNNQAAVASFAFQLCQYSIRVQFGIVIPAKHIPHGQFEAILAQPAQELGLNTPVWGTKIGAHLRVSRMTGLNVLNVGQGRGFPAVDMVVRVAA